MASPNVLLKRTVAFAVLVATLAATSVWAVTSDGTAVNSNLALTALGTITGTVRSAADGAAIPNVTLHFNSTANVGDVPMATTDASGVYRVTGLQVGTFFIRTSNSAGFIDEAFDNVPCTNCDPTAGAGVVVATTGATVSNVDFALAPGARISGTVNNAATQAPVQSVTVSFDNINGQFVASASTNAQGGDISQAPLPG